MENERVFIFVDGKIERYNSFNIEQISDISNRLQPILILDLLLDNQVQYDIVEKAKQYKIPYIKITNAQIDFEIEKKLILEDKIIFRKMKYDENEKDIFRFIPELKEFLKKFYKYIEHFSGYKWAYNMLQIHYECILKNESRSKNSMILRASEDNMVVGDFLLKKQLLIEEVRIYAECYEQGLDLKDYLFFFGDEKIKIVSVKKSKFDKYKESSIVAKFKSVKSFDAFITYIVNEDEEKKEYPFLAFEYSTAVPTDDHIMQRFDGIYWASILKIPFIKISPTKMNNTKHGGGRKIKSEHEIIAALNMKGIYKHFEWEIIDDLNCDFVDVKEERISCPKTIDELRKYMLFNYSILKQEIISCIKRNRKFSYNNIYSKLYEKHKEEYKSFLDIKLPKFRKTPRIKFLTEDSLELKFNRFGHGMDPEKGMLYFFSSIGKEVKVKFNLYRGSKFAEKKSYKQLYDKVSKEKEILEFISEKRFNFDLNDYLTMFIMATVSDKLFENFRVENGTIIKIDDKSLKEFLKNSDNQTLKSLLIFANEIIINGQGKYERIDIFWNREITQKYLEKILIKDEFFYEYLELTSYNGAKDLTEDLITYYIQKTLVEGNNYGDFKIVGVSYPGAQGDRAIKDGKGKSNKREFIDIIAYNYNEILLLEVKEKISSSKKDLKKLQNFIKNNEKVERLYTMLEKLDKNFSRINKKIKIGIIGKGKKTKDGTNMEIKIISEEKTFFQKEEEYNIDFNYQIFYIK